MCGICGFYEYQSHRPANQEVLGDMLHVLHHRGPDDSGAHFDNDLALGMRRLSIIDLSGGKQPISNEDETIVTVFNGEIYNYRELRDDLEGRGHRLATESDTEMPRRASSGSKSVTVVPSSTRPSRVSAPDV